LTGEILSETSELDKKKNQTAYSFFSKTRFRSGKKETYALCERCGGAYCSKHIQRSYDSYFCIEHK